MNSNYFTKLIFSVLIVSAAGFISACGGGGGGSDGGGVIVSGSGDQWLVLANVSKNGCGDRITDVHQTFIFNSGSVNTSIITLPLASTDSGVEFSFSETNSDCTRTYTGRFSDVSGATANVELISDSVCLTQTCQNTWSGTATKQ